MAHKKGGGSSVNGRNSQGQRLGCKRFGGQFVNAGTILIRQRGTRHKPGLNVRKGKDDTLFASITGIVSFRIRAARGASSACFPSQPQSKPRLLLPPIRLRHLPGGPCMAGIALFLLRQTDGALHLRAGVIESPNGV